MTEAVKTSDIRAIFDRWTRLQDDQDALKSDLKELFSEVKDAGLNAKALRKAFTIRRGEDGDAAVAFQADVEMYLSALGLDLATRASRASQSDDAGACPDESPFPERSPALGAPRAGAGVPTPMAGEATGESTPETAAVSSIYPDDFPHCLRRVVEAA